MKLIPEWRQAWRMFSVQALAFVAAIPVLWSELPYEVKEIIPYSWRPWLFSAIALAGLIGRLVDQGTRK